MPQRIPIFRAARLVGVSRGTLQKTIRRENISTFDGEISIVDLLALYPKADLGRDSEYERVQKIKDKAFVRRVWTRALPDAETLARRLSKLGNCLVETQTELSRYKDILTRVEERLSAANTEKDNREEIAGLLDWIRDNEPKAGDKTSPEQALLTHDAILGIMSAHIKIQPSNREFWLEGKTSILEAAVQSGISLNYGCTSGNCGLCKARIVSGEVRKTRHHDYVLSDAEKNMNHVLLCSCTAVSDLVIEALEARDQNDIPYQKITTRVKKTDPLSDKVLELHLQTPRSQRLRFLAGQSASIVLPGRSPIALPIASCPCDDRNLLFHIHSGAGEVYEMLMQDRVEKGDEILVTGPHGDFLLNRNSRHTQLYIAFGTGFAPIKSLIEHAMAIDENASMHLYWMTDTQEDLYLDNLCRSWNDALDDFHYRPVQGEDCPDVSSDGGLNLAECDAYIAGPKSRVRRAGKQLLDLGLTEDRLFLNSL
jgi:CDP-4-dehydro-6-deoxyglucose reductase